MRTPLMSRPSRFYFLVYNSLQALGWAVSLSRVLSSFISTKSFNVANASAGDLICLLQTVSFLEVLHGAVGIVPSGVLLPLMQWGGRTHFLLAIVRRLVEIASEGPSISNFNDVGLSLYRYRKNHKDNGSYSLVSRFKEEGFEGPHGAKRTRRVIRYSHYALNGLGICPSWITYLRYTAFIVLYPVGVALGEMWLMYQALPFIKKKNLYADFFGSAFVLPFTVVEALPAFI